MENWDDWGKALMNTAKRVCDVTIKHKKRKISWCWNTQVAEAIEEKRRLYKNWQKKKGDASKQKYWLQKMEVKRIIVGTYLKRLTEQKAEGLKQVFRMARQAKKNK